ncbi:DNA polymerase family B [Cooperia oncophora]
MISYMIDGKGFLIINRDIVAAEIEPFEYTPTRKSKQGRIFYIQHPMKQQQSEVRPNIIVTYNGDFFDWPFVETRAQIRGMSMENEIGFAKDSADEFKCRNCIHMDAFRWVKRDSYLPVGSQNLKAVAKAKLRYDPVEVDPEEMCKMAREDPQSLANYSVSDAVATYYLYMKYVHPFVFALCTIIPLGPDDVLRKGSGTLCEALLMVEAFHSNIVFPNKYTEDDEYKSTKECQKIESETYVGGHVEALEAGVFRADIPCSGCTRELHDSYTSMTPGGTLFRRCAEVQQAFTDLMAIPARMENPRIYHLDVGAMYPNIILTNRLQPCAMVNEEICMACCYNRPDAKCKRVMNWEWRGELTPATRGELQQIVQQLEGETFGKPAKAFHQLEKAERQAIEKKRIQDYSRRVYGKTHLTRLEIRQTMICQRENAFYVDTITKVLKKAKSSLDELSKDDIAGIKAAKGRIVLYESLQLAHKCILNSFYGYVMRKGSRWFSMEMAGIVCHTGAKIITEARKLVEQIGKPLELDTDGIWCLLPASFPENVTFALQNCKRKSITVSYPGAMLNAVVNAGFTNDQYHNLQPDGSYTITQENSIFFEVDGPYQCMVLPASKEEGKKLKKRYAVFNLDGSLAELKGFEVKRRGELNIIKHFQSDLSCSLSFVERPAEVYESASREADYWLDVLFSKGGTLSDAELFDLISENRSMSRNWTDYGGQKKYDIDAGLACKFVISRHPIGAPVTERAVPVAIFQAEEKVRCHYLKQWTKQPGLPIEKMNIREVGSASSDWDTTIERICAKLVIRKTHLPIPCSSKALPNPFQQNFRIPDWLANKIKNRFDAIRQPRITDLFQKKSPDELPPRSRDEMELEETSDKDEGNKENDPKKQRSVPEKTAETLTKKTLSRDGFDEWLRYLKKKWRLAKVNNLTRRKERGSTMVERMLTNTRESMRDRIWQILSIEETITPGIYNVWVALEGRMDRFQLRVPRIVIINEREPTEGRDVVRRVLPHHKAVHYLYEHIISGSTEQKLMNEINEKLCCSRIEGIYESQTPLMFRALTQIGCLCRPLAPPIGGVYSLESLRMIPFSSAQSYLFNDSTRTVFLVQDTRQVWTLIDSASSTGSFFIVQRGEVAMPNMDRMYSQIYDEEKDQMASGVHIQQGIKFTTRHFRVAAEAEKEINKALRVCREASVKPTLLCLLIDEEPRVMVSL